MTQRWGCISVSGRQSRLGSRQYSLTSMSSFSSVRTLSRRTTEPDIKVPSSGWRSPSAFSMTYQRPVSEFSEAIACQKYLSCNSFRCEPDLMLQTILHAYSKTRLFWFRIYKFIRMLVVSRPFTSNSYSWWKGLIEKERVIRSQNSKIKVHSSERWKEHRCAQNKDVCIGRECVCVCGHFQLLKFYLY